MPTILYSLGEAIGGVTAGIAEALPMITSLAQVGTPLDALSLSAKALGGISQARSILSANEIIRQVRGAGFSVRRGAALSVIKQLRAQINVQSYIAGLGPNQLPLAGQLHYSATRQLSKYQYHVLVTAHDRFTGEPTTQWITVSSNRLIPKAQAEFYAAAAINIGENYDVTDAVDATVHNITKAPNISP